jgi:hypothetical protein
MSPPTSLSVIPQPMLAMDLLTGTDVARRSEILFTSEGDYGIDASGASRRWISCQRCTNQETK